MHHQAVLQGCGVQFDDDEPGSRPLHRELAQFDLGQVLWALAAMVHLIQLLLGLHAAIARFSLVDKNPENVQKEYIAWEVGSTRGKSYRVQKNKKFSEVQGKRWRGWTTHDCCCGAVAHRRAPAEPRAAEPTSRLPVIVPQRLKIVAN
ncbi:uncharacterized protein LOC125537582 isoform X5 [Triticum urartu]|uniref:uncharacterized protein LOC125537582 isoform X5 n=1 Tax=Triticum urartu TaxID=4572 RepID=UPI002043E5C2|nr:uncharacterized protein LOC125537582 isoform X5 [Triticum urartu]